jgi:hypothetical protein
VVRGGGDACAGAEDEEVGAVPIGVEGADVEDGDALYLEGVEDGGSVAVERGGEEG